MTDFSQIRYEYNESVVRITFAVPERLNPLTPTLLKELRLALAQAAAEPDAKVVILAGDGDAFSVGGELTTRAYVVDKGTVQYAGLIADLLKDKKVQRQYLAV